MPYPNLLNEGKINKMRTKNRIIAGPMEKAMANRDGTLNPRYIAYLVERAKGGAGLINVESTYVDPRGQGNPFQVGCHDDKVLPGLTRLVEALHAEGARVSLELYVAGRQSSSTATLRQPLAPSVVQCSFFDPMPVPREMTRSDIDEVIKAFADAASRCLKAGIDMIHLHGAHGYLLEQFLSPWTNKRDDQYGGSAENRARFPLEVLAAVRAVVGPDYPIGYRISMEEFLVGGLTLSDTIPFCRQLARAGIDLIDITAGIYETGAEIFHGPEREHGGFIPISQQLKRELGDVVPISVTQKLNKPDLAESVLSRGDADFISMTRAFHADPHFIRKLEQDRVEDIIPCIGCHTCLNLFFGRKVAHCAVNPQSTFEKTRATRAALRPRHVTIVGGGPAGMTAARLLARQGHSVELFEAQSTLGGQLRQAAMAARDYGYFTSYLARQIEKLGVVVRLGEKIGATELAARKTDAIIIAAGSRGGYTYATTTGSRKTFNILSAFDRPIAEWEKRVVVIGGDAESCYLAIRLASARPDLRVDIVEPDSRFALNKDAPARILLMSQVNSLANIHLHPEATVEEIAEKYVRIQRRGTSEQWDDVQDVVVGGRVANSELYDALMELDLDLELYRIGDCIEPRDIHEGTQEAAKVAELVHFKSSKQRHDQREDVLTTH
jgi:2,4-dienoyl-CoA reductase-like NADH-dependent reductase (Old Yellow Enzyme family)/thioredoxin reductase